MGVKLMNENLSLSFLQEKFNGKSIKVLLADDENDLREVIKDTLQDKFNLNFIIDEAYDGEVALNLVNKNEYDIYVLDINMPKKNGIDILRYLREKEQKLSSNKKSMVLMISGFIDKLEDNPERKEILMEEKHLLSKPFKMIEFLEKIEKILISLSQSH